MKDHYGAAFRSVNRVVSEEGRTVGMSAGAKVDFDGMIFRNTNARTGRQLSVTPENSAMKHLAYARAILNLATPAVSFASGDRETALICLSGRADVERMGTNSSWADLTGCISRVIP
jgi:hypothetical protein